MPIEEPIAAIPTLSDAKRRLLAQRLKGNLPPERTPDSIPPRNPGITVPISPEQYSVWLDATLQPDVPTYNEPITLAYRGALDVPALDRALKAFIARHESWRTSFRLEQGEITQVVHAEVLVPLAFADLSHLPVAERGAESARIATEQAARPFAQDQAPLLRFTLVKFSADEFRLHLVLHHLIFDGFSLRHTFLPELVSLYTAFASGLEPTLPQLPVQYGDYAVWRRDQAHSPAMEPHLAYWRKQLAGELAVLRLPTDRPRPAAISHRGDVFRFRFARETMDRLREVASHEGATLYMALLASFKALLFRYSGQEDVIIGSVADGRRRPELAGMMGYILDIFAVRTHAAPATTFSQYLKLVRQASLEAITAAEAPFERVIHDLNVKRDLSHAPIFQTVFAFQPTADQPPAGWELYNTEITTGAAKFDLYIEADEKASHTEVRIFYSTDLFERATIERMAGHWLTLIEAAVARPATTLADLPLLKPDERELMLARWNNRTAPIPTNTLHALVEAQARKTPGAPAIRFGSTTLSYSDVEAEARHIALHLVAAGAGPENLVAVFLDRSHHLLTSLYAVLKSGAAYMPLDPGTPAARIALCLEDGAPPVILTERARVHDLPQTGATVLVVEDLLAAAPVARVLPVFDDPEALAYVIHTSGSTGRPKGVELRHGGVVNLLHSMQREPGFRASDTLVAVTTVSFDIAVLELFLPLATGGQVVIASRETALDPVRLAGLLATSGCTVFQATPATWSALLGSGWTGLPGLRALSGGEALNRSLADRLLALHPDSPLELWNLYGPTETTIWSTVRRVTAATGPVPVGQPIDNTTAYILDARQQPVPVNVPGELYLGGLGVARGYRHKPELTGEKFVSPPVVEGERIYRTGDHALFRADGTIEVLGRADNQVKIRGYRIELEDVEVNLSAHPQVALAAARAWPDPEGGHRLAGYLVGVNGQAPTPAELRHFLRDRVADYMIPSDLITLDAMPLTSNGKIDRKQLPEPPASGPAVLANTPLSGDELRMAKLWAELLRVDQISAHDNFFDLGGHSLMLLKLIRMVNKEFAVDLQIAQLFQAPTIGQLTRVVQTLADPAPAAANAIYDTLVPLNRTGTRRPIFLIHSLMLYGRLPGALGDDQPFYGLQMLAFDEHSGQNWVEEMLEDHVRQIKRVQPKGPYQIAGWCFAGLMAYEVARRLEAQGDEVATLALLDSWCPHYVPPNAASQQVQAERKSTARLHTLAWRLRFRTRQILRLPAAERWPHLRRIFRDIVKDYFVPIERRTKAALFRLFTRLNVPKPGFLHDSWIVTYEWLRRYQVRPYTGDIHLFRPAEIAVPPDSDPNCGWRTLTSGTIATTFIPGDRSTMFLTPHLGELAANLRTLLDQSS